MSRRRPSIRAAAVAAAALLLVAAGAPGVAVSTGRDDAPMGAGLGGDPEASGDGDRATASVDDRATAQQETPTENDSDVQQRNPEDLAEDGDLGRLSSYLEGRLAGRLAEGSLLISQGQYEQANDLLGDGYGDSLGKYVEVRGEIGDDDGRTESFERARDQEREFGSAVGGYRETLAAYREARENGNEARARRLARELDALATETNRTGENLSRTLAEISELTGTDLSEAIAAVDETRANITETQSEIVAETFVGTTLRVRTPATTASFDDPATIEGTVSTENGTPVGNRTVTIAVGERSYRVATDADGSFAVEYRPVGVAANASRVSVAFEPSAENPYLGSEAVVDLTVEPATASVELTETNASATFGDRLVAAGVVAVDGTPVPGVAVRVTLGGEPLGTARTNSEGRFRLETVLPAAVPAGERDLTVAGAAEDRAVAVAPTTDAVAVRETATAVEIASVAVEGETIAVRGRLLTADGAPVAEQSVAVSVDGTLLGTVRTRGDGSFAAAVEPTGDDPTTLLAAFDAAGTNLGPSSAERAIEGFGAEGGGGNPEGGAGGSGDGTLDGVLPGSGDGTLDGVLPGSGDGSPWPLVAAGVGALALVALGAWLRRRGGPTDSPDGVETADDETAADPPSPAASLLAAAQESLAAGDGDDAVERAFAAVRLRFEGGGGRTHWEFFDAVADGIDDSRRSELRRLTERFERAAFGPTPVDDDDASGAVAAAEALLGDEPMPRRDGGERG